MSEGESPKRPPGGGTRGGGGAFYDGPDFERCIDCIPFKLMQEKVDSLDSRVGSMETTLNSVALSVERLQLSFTGIKQDVATINRVLLGNGDLEKGIYHRFLSMEKGFTSVNRAAWIIAGLLIAATVGGIGKIVYAAIQSGTI